MHLELNAFLTCFLKPELYVEKSALAHIHKYTLCMHMNRRINKIKKNYEKIYYFQIYNNDWIYEEIFFALSKPMLDYANDPFMPA